MAELGSSLSVPSSSRHALGDGQELWPGSKRLASCSPAHSIPNEFTPHMTVRLRRGRLILFLELMSGDTLG